jgi:hypothetical protein
MNYVKKTRNIRMFNIILKVFGLFFGIDFRLFIEIGKNAR